MSNKKASETCLTVKQGDVVYVLEDMSVRGDGILGIFASKEDAEKEKNRLEENDYPLVFISSITLQ